MADASRKLEIIIDTNDKTKGGFNNLKSSLSSLGSFATGVGGAFAKIAGATLIAGVGAATAGIAGLALGFKSAVSAAMEAEQVQAQLEAVLKSTGGVAGVTADQVNNLANTLSRLTPFEDEAIISGENLLLTFTNIGKDVFPQATETMLDMSQALGQDLKSSAIQLGKALQDPINGVTALRRVGVNFTDAQEDMIKKLVESGDLMSAQRYILKELQTEFGGAAKAAGRTFAGQLTILKNRWGNFLEEIGGAILPHLAEWVDAAHEWFNNVTDPIIAFVKSEKFSGWMERITDFFWDRLIPSIQEFAQRIKGTLSLAIRTAGNFISTFLIPIFRRLWIWLQRNLPPTIKAVADFFNNRFLPAIRDIASWIETNLLPRFRDLWLWLQQKIPQAIEQMRLFWYNQLLPAMQTVWNWIQTNLFPVFQQLYNWLITNIPKAISIMTAFWNNTLLPAIQNIGIWIRNELVPALQVAYDWFQTKMPEAIEMTKSNLGLLGEMITSISGILDLFKTKGDEAAGIYINLGDAVNYFFERVQTIANLAQSIFTIIVQTITDALNLIKTIFTGTWDQILAAFITFGDNFRVNLWNLLRSIAATIMDVSWWPKTEPIGKAMIDGVITGWRASWDGLWSVVNGDLTSLIDAVKAKLGISSPSKIFENIGKMIPEGMSQGIAGNSEAASMAVGGMTRAMVPATVGAAGAATGGGNVYITIPYSPTISTASRAELEANLVPLIDRAMRVVERRK